MADFDDLFPDTDMLDALGDDIVYIPKAGGSYAIKCILDRNVERVGNDGYSIDRRTEIEILKAHIPHKPQRGDYIEHGDDTFKFDTTISDDGVYVRLAVSLYNA